MSNTERQRRFRASHPGYFNKYNNRKKTIRLAAQKKVIALMRELAKAKTAALQQQSVSLLKLVPKLPLMLPAPVQDVAMAELNALTASLQSKSQQATLPNAA